MKIKHISPLFALSLLFGTLPFVLNQESFKEVKADDYYASISSSLKGDELKEALYRIIKDHTKCAYSSLEVNMKLTDRNWTLSPDPNDENPYMVLLYADYNETNPQRWNLSQGSFGVSSGYVWNKEHIWAKSNGFNSQGAFAYSDLHHLRASDWKLNNTRSNNPFANGGSFTDDAFGNTSTCKCTKSTFEPSDQYKGDVARALFYMATRYYNGDGSTGTKLTLTNGTDSSGGKWGYLDTLLEWNEIDPPDEFEIHRNDLVYSLQNNRNPYIDHPEYARAVFKNEAIVEPKQITSLELSGSLTKSTYKEGETFDPTGLVVTASYDDGSTDTVTNYVTWSPLSMASGVTQVVGTYKEKTVTVTGITVITLSGLELAGTPTKTKYKSGERFDPAGLTVTATYSDGSEENVTDKVTWSPNPLAAGTTSVTGSYGSKRVTVSGIEVESVEGYKISFKNANSDGSTALSNEQLLAKIDEGSNYVSSVSSGSSTPVFEGKTGLKFSSSSKDGSLTINLSDEGKGSIQSIKLSIAGYGNDQSKALVTTNFDSTGEELDINGNDFAAYIFNLEGELETLTIKATKRFYLESIEIVGSVGPTPIEPVDPDPDTTVEPVDPVIHVNEIILSKTNIEITVQQTYALIATVSPSGATNKNVTWSSSNVEIAIVRDGIVSAIKAGECDVVVTAEDGNVSATCHVVVKEKQQVSPASASCGGNIEATSLLLAVISFSGVILLTIKKIKRYN